MNRRSLFAFAGATVAAAAFKPLLPLIEEDFTTDVKWQTSYRLIPMRYIITREELEDELYTNVGRTLAARIAVTEDVVARSILDGTMPFPEIAVEYA